MSDFDYYYYSVDKARGSEVLDALRQSDDKTKAEAIDYLIDRGYLHSEEIYNSAYVNALGDYLGISDYDPDDWDDYDSEDELTEYGRFLDAKGKTVMIVSTKTVNEENEKDAIKEFGRLTKGKYPGFQFVRKFEAPVGRGTKHSALDEVHQRLREAGKKRRQQRIAQARRMKKEKFDAEGIVKMNIEYDWFCDFYDDEEDERYKNYGGLSKDERMKIEDRVQKEIEAHIASGVSEGDYTWRTYEDGGSYVIGYTFAVVSDGNPEVFLIPTALILL